VQDLAIILGDLYLFLYDLKGKVIAHGNNPDRIGSNQFELTDDDGKYYVQEIIEKAKAGGGWLDYKVRNSSRFVYVEMVEIGTNTLVIGSGFHPISKPETMQLLVKSGVSLLQDSSKEEAFGAFVKRNGDYVKGDLSLFALFMMLRTTCIFCQRSSLWAPIATQTPFIS